MLTNRCEKKLVVLLINQKDYEHYNQQTSTNEIRFTLRQHQRTKRVNYAKQTQFTECSNKRKHCYNNGLCQYTPPQTPAKQTQSKPIQTQSNPISTPLRRKQTQFKPNSNPIQTQSNPIKPNFNPPAPKTNPIQTQFKPN